MTLLPKTQYVRSEKHRRFIASLKCVIDNKPDVQAAHIRSNTGGATSLKPSDEFCINLCCSCHSEQHRIGERIFWGHRLESAKKLAQDLYAISGDTEAALKLIREFRGW